MDYKTFETKTLPNKNVLVNLNDRCAIIKVDREKNGYLTVAVLPLDFWTFTNSQNLENSEVLLLQEEIKSIESFKKILFGSVYICEVCRVVTETQTRICELHYKPSSPIYDEGDYKVKYTYVSWHEYAGCPGTVPDTMCDREDRLSIKSLIDQRFYIS